MMNDYEAITAERANQLTHRKSIISVYLVNLEDEILRQISYGNYQASIEVRENQVDDLRKFFLTLGYLVTINKAAGSYVSFTVDWSEMDAMS